MLLEPEIICRREELRTSFAEGFGSADAGSAAALFTDAGLVTGGSGLSVL